ncbi:MAG: glutathione S-transferase family protein [Alcaligenaceae bacterium]|nr:MAG: glutathione S-transferase family protein [Alcaligenaceae bacterium]
MKLYYLPGACSLAPHIALQWLGKPYETHRLSREALKGPEYLAINPLGAVPAITEGDWSLTQNIAILEYIAEQDPTLNLLGQNTPRARAEVRRWLGFVNADIHKMFSLVFGAQQFHEDATAQEALRQAAMKRLVTLFGVVNEALAQGPYLTGDRKTVADAYLYVVLRWAHAKSLAIGELTHLARFFKTMEQEPGVQAALKDEGLA